MSENSFDINEFMKPPVEPVVQVAEIDVQKAVVEELAAEKVELHENISTLEAKIAALSEKLEVSEIEISKRDEEIASLNKSLDDANSIIASKCDEIEVLKKEISEKNAKILALDAKVTEKLLNELDQQERNPNALALLDREVELPDRFPGETRDHVLEVVKDARDEAEKAGRRRRAQLLEGVLVANEPNGGLAKKRAALEKFFKDNGNIMTGLVMKELDRCGIPYKDAEGFLLPKEILLRTY